MARKAFKSGSELKSKTITVRITEEQQAYIDKLIVQGKAKNNAATLQYLITKHMALFPEGE
ncbi:hypothetical protein CTI66_18480 [Klebsiella pneumoniae]|jgi:Arc/MetJ-type ribon-helix-helix transcriptional regulator|uniref:hypothetical protein n=1 Tax=Enterobacteriaceae TaxID=543 RepID=UPI000C1999D2|nr:MULTISPECIES: hypothetical protein [Enterobacteriaceae]ATR53969.1 hypothetical protein CTI66_18480 [Klebsiella pneumoniae]MBK4470901.1 hypothetical protein [Enterobacter hormaechei]VAL73954.1 Uncharacterised protein [Enterobacter hormaechei]HBQ6493275.1 hypothetical protein [Klebsiella pneumoniae]HEL6320318.1 hypothetical protein [Klebsiella pneumoniae]